MIELGRIEFRYRHTLQELKLQDIKIRDGVAFSRYSRAQCFAINLSDFDNLLKCLCSSVGRVPDVSSVDPGFKSQSGQPYNRMIEHFSVVFRQLASVGSYF